MERDCQTSKFMERVDKCVEIWVQEEWLKSNTEVGDCGARSEANREAR
jgi:hypothetical protein